MTARYRILAWDGIPAQLKVVDDAGGTVSAPLPDWFMQEVDREAMRRGVVGSDDYLELWAWSEERERDGTADEVAAAVTAELLAEWQGRGGPAPA